MTDCESVFSSSVIYFAAALLYMSESGLAGSLAKGAPVAIDGREQTSLSHFYMLSRWTQ